MNVRDLDWISHKDYLDNCSYDDLMNLRGFIKERIESIQQEERVVIYGVEGVSTIKGWFLEYEDAYACFCEKAVPEVKDEFSCGDLIGIVRKRVFQSEVSEYVD